MSTATPTLGECLAAYLFYQRTHETSTTRPPAAFKAMKRLIQKVDKCVSPEISRIEIPLKLIRLASYGQPAMNVYLNMIQNRDIFKAMDCICNAISLLTTELDMSTNDAHKVLEYADSEHCVLPGCEGRNCRLEPIYRSLKQNKGTICIIHDNVRGPQIGIAHSKRCVDCRALYYPLLILHSDGGKTYLPPKNGLYQSTSSLFMHENTFYESGNLLNEQGVAHSYYVKTYNRRFAPSRKIISKILRDLKQKLGRHKSPDPNMEEDSFRAAYYMYFLQKAVNVHLCQDELQLLHLSADEIQKFKAKEALRNLFVSKSSRKFPAQRFGKIMYRGKVKFASGKWIGIILNQQCGRNNGTIYGKKYFESPPGHGILLREEHVDEKPVKKIKDNYISVDNQFKILYRRYQQDIAEIPESIFCAVPTLNGVPHQGHRINYGDGNARSRLLCQIPHPIFNAFHPPKLEQRSQLHKTQREYRQCAESPFNGNKSTHTFDICRSCVFTLSTETDLKTNEINHCVKYWNLKAKLDGKQREGVLQKLSRFSQRDAKRFDRIYKLITESSASGLRGS